MPAPVRVNPSRVRSSDAAHSGEEPCASSPGSRWVLHYALRSVSSLWPVGVNSRLISIERPLSRALRRSQQSGLRAIDSGHVLQDRFVVLVLYDGDPTPRPRVPAPFLEVPPCLLMDCTISPEYDRRVRSPCASVLGLWYAFVDADGVLPCVVSGRRPGPLLMDCGALL
ncbi:Hypothetical protein DHA2_154554 [Giardia duodenalis]|uniref:Uncharacterized protein n=1 Tax=Giardia intestinalis TaxID=5741 RepID=V6THA0_GIAIN|nr:Hypothetical protein DHA2_154554 [Giardia intestinalis]